MRVTIVSVTHVPASTFKDKSGTDRQKAESWECIAKYPASVYSRAQRKNILVTKEGPLDAAIAVTAGDYEATIDTDVAFDNLKVVILGVEPAGSAPAKSSKS
jgi:hypothetical protein